MAKDSNLLLTKLKTMKKIIIKNEQEIMNALMTGRIVEGRLVLVRTNDGQMTIEFKAYNRKPKKRSKDRLVCYLEHGWVKESPERIKVFESLPKRLGGLKMAEALDREIDTVADLLLENRW